MIILGASVASEESNRSAASSRQGSNQRGIRLIGKIAYDPEQVSLSDWDE